jgi:hypothetical protein
VATCTIASHRRDLAGAIPQRCRGDILPKADSERAATCVAIPEWMERDAAGAAEVAPKLPRWVPSAAQRTIKLLALSDLRRDQRAILTRLATDPRMQIVWNALARIGGGNESDVILHAFLRSCQVLPYKPPFPRRKKDMEKRVFDDAKALTKPGAKIYDLADVAVIASWLVSAMENTAPDAKVFLKNDPSASFEHLLNLATYIANVYGNLSAQQSSLNNAFPLPPIGKLAAKDAPKRIFSAAMTNYFRELFDKAIDDAVAVLTDVVFNSNDGTGSTTIRGRRRSAQRRHIRAKNRQDVPRT